jgi:hypothetical protein
VRDFAWLNPHATFAVNGKTVFKATDPDWPKWRPSDAAPAAWYDHESFSRLIAACVADDEDHGRDRTVREFIADFRGLARTGIQKQVLDNTAAARMSLRDFFKRPARVKHLLAIMQDATKPVGAKDLGALGREHFQTRFDEVGADLETFQYRRSLLAVDDVPFAIEAAFGYCPDEDVRQQQIVGVNWSPSLINPFRDLNNDISLDYLLADQRAGEEQPIVLALHLASPCIAYTDKAKSALALPDEVAARLVMAVKGVTERWAKQCKQEERDASARDRRHERLIRSRKESQTDVAFEIMEKGYLKVSDDGHGGRLPANARQIMYACRDEIQERSERMLSDNYFTQTLLPDFMTANPELTADWDVTFDDRGHFTEPHTGREIGLGTLAVRGYIESMQKLKPQTASLAPARIITRGPHGAYGALLYVEKEGFDELFERVQLAERFDIATMSCKGMSVVAARKLVDAVCHAYRLDLFVLHDFDKAGFSIRGTFVHKTSRRYTFEHKIKVVDLGLRLDDVRELRLQDEAAAKERVSKDPAKTEMKRRANLQRNGATPEEIEFLRTRRVELNAMTSAQLLAFIQRKLTEHRVKKIVPTKADLAEAYRTFAHGREAEKVIKRELAKLSGASVAVPHDLKAQVEDYLRRHPTTRWDEAVAAICGGAP